MILLLMGISLILLSIFSKSKKRQGRRRWYLAAGIVILFWVGFRFYDESLYQTTHLHANFKVFLEGKEVDFAKPEFMTESKEDHPRKVHLHDLNGGVVHVHYPHITWGNFFKSLGMELGKNCFSLDGKKKYCSMRFFVNDQAVEDLADSEIRDLDRVLVSYGSPNITPELASVPEDACVYSNQCPERGQAKGIESKGGCVAG